MHARVLSTCSSLVNIHAATFSIYYRKYRNGTIYTTMTLKLPIRDLVGIAIVWFSCKRFRPTDRIENDANEAESKTQRKHDETGHDTVILFEYGTQDLVFFHQTDKQWWPMDEADVDNMVIEWSGGVQVLSGKHDKLRLKRYTRGTISSDPGTLPRLACLSVSKLS